MSGLLVNHSLDFICGLTFENSPHLAFLTNKLGHVAYNGLNIIEQ